MVAAVSCPYQKGRLNLEQCLGCSKLDVHIGDKVSPTCRAQKTSAHKKNFKAAYLATFYCPGVDFPVDVEEAAE